jgi:beta-galactosidase
MIRRRDFLKGSAAALLYQAGHNAFSQPSNSGGRVSFDERSVIVDGRRRLLTCGSVHYPRSTRAMWPIILERSKALGLNTITSYVFWNFHESNPSVYDFSGERDLGHYIDLCQRQGLSVFLRVGPYICAEWNFGGFPPYLRDVPGITIRTMNKAYTDRVEAYFERLAKVVTPRLASNGGPIILVQVENEYANVSKRYGEAGQEYLRWIVELATRVGFAGVPTTTCEGGAQGAIETSNGSKITPERIAALRKSHPGTPLLWTELYPAWYRVWGGEIVPARDPGSIARSILDFVSRGGSGVNYYMWHGGTNFGRNSMYLQTTSYDFYAPIDEYGNVTATGQYLGNLHAVLQEHSAILLDGEASESRSGAQRITTWRHGSEELRLMQDDYRDHPAPGGQQAMNLHARLLNAKGEVLFDTDAMRDTVARSFIAAAWKPVAQADGRPLEWKVWDEPLPQERADRGVVSAEPVEQLSLTKDSTDYCWYSTEFHVADAGPQQILIPYGGDFFYVFVDGQLVATSALPLPENRGAITPEDPAHPRILANPAEAEHQHGYQHSFSLPQLGTGTHRLDLLAVAIGMIKGDWQIASPMNFERKGIWEGVLRNGQPLQNWTMRTGMTGEQEILPMRPEKISSPMTGGSRPLRWFHAQMQVPENLLRSSGVFRIDASGLGKGMIWVNGHAVGRHWLIEADKPPQTPSQRYYHVPADWLMERNEIVIFEEQAVTPERVQLQVRI